MGSAATQAVRQEIERTRRRMDGAIDELQRRMSPEYIATRAKEVAQRKARSLGSSAASLVRENPVHCTIAGSVAAAILAASIGQRAKRRGDRRQSHERRPVPRAIAIVAREATSRASGPRPSARGEGTVFNRHPIAVTSSLMGAGILAGLAVPRPTRRHDDGRITNNSGA